MSRVTAMEAVMSFLFPTTPTNVEVLNAPLLHQPILYLTLAGLCLVIVLRFLKRALAPIGALVQAVAAAAVVAFAAVVAVAMVIVAAFHSIG
jgi:hypothetical protein